MKVAHLSGCAIAFLCHNHGINFAKYGNLFYICFDMFGKSFVFLSSLLALAGCASGVVEDVGAGFESRHLHAPWSGAVNDTRFCCHSTADRFFFSFEASDTTLTLSESFPSKRTVDYEDRVEIFFCPSGGMEKGYHCAEIDPSGRVMDYAARYYREFDFGWNFKTLQTCSALTPFGYRVSGSVSRDELEELGLKTLTINTGVFDPVFEADVSNVEVAGIRWFPRMTRSRISTGRTCCSAAV